MAEMEEDRVLPVVVHDPKLVIVRGETRMTKKEPPGASSQLSAISSQPNVDGRTPMREEFDPDQARDEQGEWTSGGGGGAGAENQAAAVLKNVHLSNDEIDSLHNYKGIAGPVMNAHLRGLPGFEGIPVPNEDIARIDAALNRTRLVGEATVYRGADLPNVHRNYKSLTGKTITDKGFISTTFSEDRARMYASGEKNPVLFRISVPAGTKGIYMDGLPKSEMVPQVKESELLLARGSKFRITAAKKQGRVVFVNMEAY